MNLIVAVDKNWAIGNKGELLVRIPADHKMFRQETTGKVVVLGRKTMDTFPGGQPLKNRDNIILSRNEAYQQKDAQVVHSVEELLEAVINIAPERIVYVSCDPATMARDIKILCEEGYDFIEATPVDMFPNTDSVETVVLLSKTKIR